MATQNYFRNAPGDASKRPTPDGPTPAPVRPLPPLDTGTKEDSDPRAGLRYGRNQSLAPSSIPSGTALSSDFDISVRDDVKDTIQRQGLRRDDSIPGIGDDELRKIGENNVPLAYGHSVAKPGPRVPSTLGEGEAPLPRTDTYGGVKS